MKNKKMKFMSLICVVLVFALIYQVVENRSLEKENTCLTSYKEEVANIKDSISIIRNSNLLVNNIKPIVMEAKDESSGRIVKRVYFAIRDCDVFYTELTLGRLDSNYKIQTPLYKAQIKDSSFNFFNVPDSLAGGNLEGSVGVLFPRLGLNIFPFSEKHNGW